MYSFIVISNWVYLIYMIVYYNSPVYVNEILKINISCIICKYFVSTLMNVTSAVPQIT